MNNPAILFPTALFPHVPDLLLEDVLYDDQTLYLVLRSTAPTAACPLCQQPATRIHSHYARHPADLPWAGHVVRFELHARKFFCSAPACPRRIFTERLLGVITPSARTTTRLTILLRRPERCSDAERETIGQFAVKIRKDEAAVRAGCTLSWSNGQTEGQVTQLKLLKRQMYGRAKSDLLRQRALAA